MTPRGSASKIKAQKFFPSDKFMGVFSGFRQVNALRGVCGSDGVERVEVKVGVFWVLYRRGCFLGVSFHSYC